MAVDGDAGLVELHVLMDMSSVRATALHHEGDNTPDINLFVTSLGGNPVRGVLAADQALHDGALRLEVLGHDIDITSPGTLGTTAYWKEQKTTSEMKSSFVISK